MQASSADMLYTYAQRLNLGVIREDLNALWNFGPHDISILLYLLDAMPVRVSARQFRVLNRRLEDVAFLVLEFPGGVVGHIHESWLDPRKVRELTVVGDHKMVVYDDTDVESPLRIYDKGVTPLPRRSASPARRRRCRAGGLRRVQAAGARGRPADPARRSAPSRCASRSSTSSSCVATGPEPLTRRCARARGRRRPRGRRASAREGGSGRRHAKR